MASNTTRARLQCSDTGVEAEARLTLSKRGRTGGPSISQGWGAVVAEKQSVAGFPQPPRLILIRHATTDWNEQSRLTSFTDLPLNERGIRQAESLRWQLQSLHLRNPTILTSPSLRARQTQAIAFPQATARVARFVRECNFGRCEGRRLSDLESEALGWDFWKRGCPEGEELSAVARRAQALLKWYVSPNSDTVVFSHGVFIRVLASSVLSLEAHHGRKLHLDPAAVSIIGASHPNRLLAWNRSASPGR
ncbi:histidine phosphatase family protein [Micromonospora purpureochromogenes]|uniref:histidine phosphatase family protein n=1 Tax=Micromonospora purpureochromogenes TaxID=47872 RepID=UPI00358DAA24